MPERSVAAPSVIWLTGLSGAGKSTIAAGIHRALTRAGVAVETLDGDALRSIAPTGFTIAERNAHVRRAGFIASRLEYHGVTVVCALTSPSAHSRLEVRRMCRRFIEVHVSTPLAECERRDPKGLYAAARRGDLGDVVGIHIPYEPSPAPDIVLDTTNRTAAQSVAWVLERHARFLGFAGAADRDARLPEPFDRQHSLGAVPRARG